MTERQQKIKAIIERYWTNYDYRVKGSVVADIEAAFALDAVAFEEPSEGDVICGSIYGDYDYDEIKSQPTSTRKAWEHGQALHFRLRRAPDAGLCNKTSTSAASPVLSSTLREEVRAIALDVVRETVSVAFSDVARLWVSCASAVDVFRRVAGDFSARTEPSKGST